MYLSFTALDAYYCGRCFNTRTVPYVRSAASALALDLGILYVYYGIMEKATKARRGRKPDGPEPRSERFEMRLTVAEKVHLISNGGARWVRQRLFGKKS